MVLLGALKTLKMFRLLFVSNLCYSLAQNPAINAAGWSIGNDASVCGTVPVPCVSLEVRGENFGTAQGNLQKVRLNM